MVETRPCGRQGRTVLLEHYKGNEMSENDRPALRVQLIFVATFYALPYYDGRATELGNDLKNLTQKYEQHPEFADITPATTFTTLAAAVIERMPDDPLVVRMLATREAAITQLYDQIPPRSEEQQLRTAA